MESGETEEGKKTISGSEINDKKSAENFQKFVYDLFEKNGIINDLRAYLRGHIVNVLRSAQTGDPPACQKHFVQRLDVGYQALNILIAEYFLRLEFTYSLSVFVSEIPLANMLFDFAKTLMRRSDDDEMDIRFTESDVWCILNYLGVPCDSEYASRIIQMYKSDKQSSLLQCILKCRSLYEDTLVGMEKVASSEDALRNRNSSDSECEKNGYRTQKIQSKSEKCKHIKFCKTCQNNILEIKDKYKNKKANLQKMFHQLQLVYESEVEMIKKEEGKKLERSIASQVLQLQKEKEEMEQSFKAREEQLQRDIIEKKKFLWGLARALRDQHQHMSRAMHDVRLETDRLCAKEQSLKTQLAEAEKILQKRGEEMRLQIANEISILEAHLNSMKDERESINKERQHLENLKTIENSAIKMHKINTEELNSHYELIRTELGILKEYLESSKMSPICVIERGMVTEQSNGNIRLNNNTRSRSADRSKNDESDDKIKNQVVNDFKKKNVNFSPSKLDEIYRDLSPTRSHSSGSIEIDDNVEANNITYHNNDEADIIRRLTQENIRLKECARHQQVQIAVLSRATSLMPTTCACTTGAERETCSRAETRARPRTAPPNHVLPVASAAVSTPTSYQPFNFLRNMNTSISANTVSVGWRKGAGEELSMFRDAQPRVLVPGDTIPFVGVLKDRDQHTSSRRQMVSQWRALRSRTYPLSGISKRTVSPLKERHGSSSPTVIVSNAKASCSLQSDDVRPTYSMREKTQHGTTNFDVNISRQKSPKSVLREAKAKLRNVKEPSICTRERSPNSILREAKQRLRKLEIEAEVIEKSYRDYRRRQSELKLEKNSSVLQNESPIVNLDTKRIHSLYKLENSSNNWEASLTDYQKPMRCDVDKYLREYQTKADLTGIFFRTQTAADIVNPIPSVYSEVKSETKVNNNYLETPLTDFRKLYQSNIKIDGEIVSANNLTSNTSKLTESDDSQSKLQKQKNVQHHRHSKASELEILKQNINKIYNIDSDNIERANIELDNIEPERMDNIEPDLAEERSITKVSDIQENLLRIEIESVNGTDDTGNVSVVIQSSVIDSGPISVTDSPHHVMASYMTIIVSPKDSIPKDEKSPSTSPERVKRSSSPEHEAYVTRNDVLNAIFQTDTDQKSSTVIDLDLSKDNVYYEKVDDYDDNLSGQADNYNSHDVEFPNSPISINKTSEDENDWE